MDRSLRHPGPTGRLRRRALTLLGATVIAADLVAMSGYGLAGRALAAAMRQTAARRCFSTVVGVLLLAAAAMIVLRA